MGTNHGTPKDMIILVQVPQVNHSILERHELDLGKKTNHAQQKMQNAKRKGIRIFQVSKSSSCTQKKISCFLQGRGVLSETHAVPQQLLGCYDLGWYCGQHPGAGVVLGVKVIEKSWKIMANHLFPLWFFRKLQLFPHFFLTKLMVIKLYKSERFPL